MIRYLTAGESHGRALVGIIEGVPAGLPLDADYINHQLRRRQLGYGRGERMRIEQDRVQILSGIRLGRTLGSPITLLIENRDWENWKEVMAVEEPSTGGWPTPVTVPRPGHADLAGAIKYSHRDIRNVLERSSARETAVRVAVGAVCRRLLEEFGVGIISYVVSIGEVGGEGWDGREELDLESIDRSPVRCLRPGLEAQMVEAIDRAKAAGDTLGGVFEVVATGVPIGLGSYLHWDRRLDGQLAQALMSIPAVKGVEVGLGFEGARRPGSQVHDEIFYQEGRYLRQTNRAGGLEGGVSNGEPIVLRAAVKPVPTLMRPLRSVNLIKKGEAEAFRERADVCVVPAAAVVGEAMMALALANALTEKFGGDSLEEMKGNYRNYTKDRFSLDSLR